MVRFEAALWGRHASMMPTADCVVPLAGVGRLKFLSLAPCRNRMRDNDRLAFRRRGKMGLEARPGMIRISRAHAERAAARAGVPACGR